MGESNCCESLGEEVVMPMVNPDCVVTITMRKAENASGGEFCSSPGALPLPATDGSNCAETHVSHS